MIDIPVNKYNRKSPPDNSQFGKPIDVTSLENLDGLEALARLEKVYKKVPVINGGDFDPDSAALILKKQVSVSKEATLYSIDNATLHLPSGAVINENGELLKESLWGAALHGFPAFRNDKSTGWQWRIESEMPVGDLNINLPIAYCYNRSHYQFYHFFLDCLSRYYLLEKMLDNTENVRILIGKFDEGSFQREALRLIGVKSEQLITSEDCSFELTHVKKIYFPSPVLHENVGLRPSYKDGVHYKYADSSYFNWLRERFLKGVEPESVISSARIYLKRGSGSGRNVNQEQDLIEKLEQFGVIAVDPGAIPFEEQLKYFLDAELVIGPHGAAFTHLVWAPEKCTVLEFISANYDDPGYKMICAEKGMEHHLILGRPCDPLDHRTDYYIDVETVIRFVRNFSRTRMGWIGFKRVISKCLFNKR